MTDLGVQKSCGTNLTLGVPQVHALDLAGAVFGQHGGGGWCWMYLDSGQLKKVAL